MAKSVFRTVLSLQPELRDTAAWPGVHITNWSAQRQRLFSKRRRAVEHYLQRDTLAKVSENAGLTRQEIERLLDRCFTLHPDGSIFGFRALIPNSRTKQYERALPATIAQRGYAGCLQQLLTQYPEIEESLRKWWFGRGDKESTAEPCMTLYSIHDRFLRKLVGLGVGVDEWPFTTKSQGRESLRRHLRSMELTHPAQAQAARYLSEGRRPSPSAFAVPSPVLEALPYERVEFDAHTLDVMMTVGMSVDSGPEAPVVIQRISVLVLIDIASRAVLGYHLVLRPSYNAVDVLHCFYCAVAPWRPMETAIPELSYPPGAGLPSGVIEGCAWRAFDLVCLDNARANLAQSVVDRASRIVQCRFNFGPSRTPERRAIVERLFRTIASEFHRLPSTTGSHPKDPRRQYPAKAAKHFDVRVEEIEQLLDVIIARYNVTSHESLHHRTPLDVLRHDIRRSTALPRYVLPSDRQRCPLLEFEVTRVVRGDPTLGRQPHVNYEGVRYVNDVLIHTPDLIGKTLTLVVDPTDLRHLHAYLPNGASIGLLRASGHWSRTPHGLRVRQAVNSLRKRRPTLFTGQADPIHVYQQHLQRKAGKSLRAATRWAETRQPTSAAAEDLPEDDTAAFDMVDPDERITLSDTILD